MTFGKRLQALRKEHNISQEKLAEAINVSRQAISKWEQDLVIPDTENLLLVSKYFDIPMEMKTGHVDASLPEKCLCRERHFTMSCGIAGC